MKVRIAYRSEIFIDGENIAEIQDKFESLDLGYSDLEFDGYQAGYAGLITVKDADTYEDLMHDWDCAYDKTN